jgi:amidase
VDRLVFATASDLAAAIRQRDVSATEVLDAHLAQIARTTWRSSRSSRATRSGRLPPMLPAPVASCGHALLYHPVQPDGQPRRGAALARAAEGLPIGVQLVGRRWGDMALLAVATRLAAVIGPWQPPQGY